ncbi:hypothetical protein TNCV_4019521 [Trichonephila clavipes]|nr:hypothetical protein TNCV_4019521 [Trichonephila clavipes]
MKRIFLGNEQNKKKPTGLDCPTVLSEVFVAVDDGNVCAAPIIADNDILEFVLSSKKIEADSDNENEMNNTTPVPTPFEMRNIVKSILSYLGVHSNGEFNNKMDDIEQFDAKKDNARKDIRLFFKKSSNVFFFKNLKIMC